MSIRFYKHYMISPMRSNSNMWFATLYRPANKGYGERFAVVDLYVSLETVYKKAEEIIEHDLNTNQVNTVAYYEKWQKDHKD